ncbi:hypothetical protein L1887_21248 [Cichorium endivia]|nr:hypothetical protein L1887_21248 [Cichorium endivia]
MLIVAGLRPWSINSRFSNVNSLPANYLSPQRGLRVSVVYASIRFTPISRQAQQARALACPYTQTVFCGCASSRADKNICDSGQMTIVYPTIWKTASYILTSHVTCNATLSKAQSKNLLSPLQPENYFHLSSFMALFPQIWRQYMC